MTHERRPRIQKMKCLAPKLTKRRRIENFGENAKLNDFLKLRDLHLVKLVPTVYKVALTLMMGKSRQKRLLMMGPLKMDPINYLLC